MSPFSSSVITIGNFDGVHLGHQALIARVRARAQQMSLPSVVVTFEPHPIKVLHPERKFHRIFDIEDQIEQLSKFGIDVLAIEPFSREFSQLPPERFLSEWIFKPFVPRAVIVGYDFSFGAHRQGSIDFLKGNEARFGFELEVVAPVKIGDVIASSSRIRQAVEAGEVAFANALLGRRFYLRGLVERGAGRGRTIGVPTANMRTNAELVPARGVYACFASVQGRRWMAAVNVGLNPTFVDDERRLRVEAHLLDFSGDIYGENFKLEFVERIRDERKFASAAELTVQIRSDLERCRARLSAPDFGGE